MVTGVESLGEGLETKDPDALAKAMAGISGSVPSAGDETKDPDGFNLDAAIADITSDSDMRGLIKQVAKKLDSVEDQKDLLRILDIKNINSHNLRRYADTLKNMEAEEIKNFLNTGVIKVKEESKQKGGLGAGEATALLLVYSFDAVNDAVQGSVGAVKGILTSDSGKVSDLFKPFVFALNVAAKAFEFSVKGVNRLAEQKLPNHVSAAAGAEPAAKPVQPRENSYQKASKEFQKEADILNDGDDLGNGGMSR